MILIIIVLLQVISALLSFGMLNAYCKHKWSTIYDTSIQADCCMMGFVGFLFPIFAPIIIFFSTAFAKHGLDFSFKKKG